MGVSERYLIEVDAPSRSNRSERQQQWTVMLCFSFARTNKEKAGSSGRVVVRVVHVQKIYVDQGAHAEAEVGGDGEERCWRVSRTPITQL